MDLLPRLLVAPATTTIRDLPSEVALDALDGVTTTCVLNLDTPELVSRYALVEYTSTLSAHRWAESVWDCRGRSTADERTEMATLSPDVALCNIGVSVARYSA